MSFVKRLFGRAAACQSDDDDEVTDEVTDERSAAMTAGDDHNGNVPACTCHSPAGRRCPVVVMQCRRCGGTVGDQPRSTTGRGSTPSIRDVPRAAADRVDACSCATSLQLPRCRHSTDSPHHHACLSHARRGRPRSLSPVTGPVQRCHHGAARDDTPPPLPPSIARSPDGEEGYAVYRRRLERFGRSTQARDAVRSCVVPPPNRTASECS